MDLPPGQLTPLLQEWVVRLGSWVPFGQVPCLLAVFAGLTINRETARRQTEAAGSYLVAAETRTAPAVAPPADPGPDSEQRLQVSADGAMVRLQSGEWVEVKTVAVGQVGSRRAADGTMVPHSSAVSYFSRHAPAAEFTAAAALELHRRGVRAAGAVAGVMDGALWLQGFLDYHRPDAVRILDLPHAAEHLGALAAALWGEGSGAAQQWQAAQVKQLREHGAAPLMTELTLVAREYGPHAALEEHGEYLRRRVAQMDYPAFQAAGWPIGSGMVESGNKLVVEARLKGAGMGWAVANLNPMLALRNGVCNDRWGEVWATIRAGQRTEQAGGAGRVEPGATNAPERGAPPAGINPAVVAEVEAILERVAAEVERERGERGIVQGKPGPRHPWRHSPIGQACPADPVAR